jgi:hypothetical protein
MTLSSALAAQLDRFIDPRARLLTEAQQLLLDGLAIGDVSPLVSPKSTFSSTATRPPTPTGTCA